MAKVNTSSLEARCAGIAEEMGFELVDICLDREPSGVYLRFYIDKPEGISLDDCEKFHKQVRPLAEPLDFDFMEVSSPGLDRPLKKDRDFERALGSEIEVRLFKAIQGSKVLTGILTGFGDGELVLKTDQGEINIPRKSAALVKPVVDMEGIEEVDLSDGGQAENFADTEESGEEE